MNDELERLIAQGSAAVETLQKADVGSEEFKRADKECREAWRRLQATHDNEKDTEQAINKLSVDYIQTLAPNNPEGQIKELILLEVEAAIEMRDQQAEESPDDPRHAQSAAGLRQLADYLRSIEEHPLFYKIPRMDEESRFFFWGDFRWYINFFGFQGTTDPKEFLDRCSESIKVAPEE